MTLAINTTLIDIVSIKIANIKLNTVANIITNNQVGVIDGYFFISSFFKSQSIVPTYEDPATVLKLIPLNNKLKILTFFEIFFILFDLILSYFSSKFIINDIKNITGIIRIHK